jgi:SAM-dependent methyltransferase
MEALMKKTPVEKTDYGNWVSTKFIYVPGMIGLVFAGLAFWLPALGLLAGLFLLLAAYFAYARYLFAPQGKNVQEQIRALLLAHFDWDGEGRVLDIGCGNAALVIQLAKKYPRASVVGIDYWGGNWEYSKEICEKNAQIEGVDQQVVFQKASASRLPFPDGYFDAAVSNLTFHEVADAVDKRDVIREALRVVKKGGKFAFQDLFLIDQAFGKTDDLLQTIRSWGISRVEFVETRNAPFIAPALKLPFMVGTIGMLVGEK